MLNRYLAKVALTSLALATLLAATPPPRPSCPPAPHSLYSPRALHRMRMMLLLRLDEARRKRLAAVEAAIAGRTSIAEVLALPDDSAILAQGRSDPRLKHLRPSGTSICW